MSVPRFHVPEVRSSLTLPLPEAASHHAAHVLRLQAGAAVRVFDGEGHEFEATLASDGKRGLGVCVGVEVAPRPESPLHLTLAIAPLKGDRMDWVVQKATELGVVVIQPVVTARTDAEGRPALAGARTDRWRKIASGAAEQCGRARVPVVRETVHMNTFLREPRQSENIILLETGENPPLGRTRAVQAILVLVGPAGGFAPDEVEAAIRAGFAPRSLGPRILRAETAAIASLAALQTLFGDLAGR